ncbi:MAG: ABC transporter permease [candidate division WOR-3 bacterium]
MTGYLVRRVIHALLILLVVTLFVFFIMRVLPGDPIYMYMSMMEVQNATEEQIMKVKKEWGLDKPIVIQYLDWVWRLLQGDMGRSLLHRDSVGKEIRKRLPRTAYLGFLALIISAAVGIPTGIISAIRRATWLDNLVTVIANFGITVPIFWLGIIFIYLFGLHLRWLPVQGYVSPAENLWLSLKHAILPVLCLATLPTAAIMRQMRSSTLEVLRQDYVRTAWAKGLQESTIIRVHVLKNALIPVITLMGVTVRVVFGGSVLVETVFNIPGIGRLTVEGILAQDYPIVQGTLLVISAMVLLANLIVDLSYGWLDPRVKYE